MSKLGFSLALLLLCMTHASAQNVPLFTQKITQTSIYNPAQVGSFGPSVTFAFKDFWAGAEGSSVTSLLSAQSPITKNNTFGIGINLYSEEINIFRNTYVSTSFAYHINMGGAERISFGLGLDYAQLRLDRTLINYDGWQDDFVVSNQEDRNNVDFSAGVNYENEVFYGGISFNRIRAALEEKQVRGQANPFNSFFTAYLAGTFLVNDRDLLEPYVLFRQLENQKAQLEVGTYFTLANKIITGLNYRSSASLSGIIGIRLNDKWTFAYNHEIFGSGYLDNVLSSNEFGLRFDFGGDNYLLRRGFGRGNSRTTTRSREMRMGRGAYPRSARPDRKAVTVADAFSSGKSKGRSIKRRKTQKIKKPKGSYKLRQYQKRVKKQYKTGR